MKNKFKKILSEISPGELLDKISILEIKMEKVKDKNSQDEIKKQWAAKLYIHNTPHCIAAYLGSLCGKKYLHEGMSVTSVNSIVPLCPSTNVSCDILSTLI